VHEGIGSAEIGGILQGFKGHERGIVSGEESDLQRAASDINRYPLGVLRAAERVLLEETARGRNTDAVELAIACGVHGFVEGGTDLGWLEQTDRRDGEGCKVDGDFGAGEGDVACDVRGRVAGGSPVAFFRLLRGSARGAGERERQKEETYSYALCNLS